MKMTEEIIYRAWKYDEMTMIAPYITIGERKEVANAYIKALEDECKHLEDQGIEEMWVYELKTEVNNIKAEKETFE